MSREKPLQYYHVGCNVPGYLPKTDVVCCDSSTAAADVFLTMYRRAVGRIQDTAEYITEYTWLYCNDTNAVATEIDKGIGFSRSIRDNEPLPTVYWVMNMVASAEACEHHGDGALVPCMLTKPGKSPELCSVCTVLAKIMHLPLTEWDRGS